MCALVGFEYPTYQARDLQSNNSDVFALIFLSTFDGFYVYWLMFRVCIKHYPGKVAVSCTM